MHYLLDLRVWLLFESLIIVCFLFIAFHHAFRRNPPGFMWRTFMDDRGVPDSKSVALVISVTVLVVNMGVGWSTGHWPPWYVMGTWDTIALAGLFGIAYVQKKYYEAGGSTDYVGHEYAPPTAPASPETPIATETASPADEEFAPEETGKTDSSWVQPVP